MDRPSYLLHSEQWAKIDARSTNYQFDLEADIAWQSIGAPGLYAPPSLVSDVGLPTELFRCDAEEAAACDAFQWAASVLVAEVFIELERAILRFIEHEGSLLGQKRSLVLLCEEEQKHIALFLRYGAALRRLQPSLAKSFEPILEDALRAFREGFDRAMNTSSDAVERRAAHYLFWMNVIFFEEYTVYFANRLEREANEIQPTWLSAHRAHRREEIQHLVTDAQCIRAIDVSPSERHEYGRVFVLQLTKNFARHLQLDAAMQLATLLRPELAAYPVAPAARTSFYRDIFANAPEFRRTRALAAGEPNAPERR